MKYFVPEEKYIGTITDAAQEYGVQIPSEFICPITLEVMIHPLMSRCGHNFERHAILEWISNGNGGCPLTRQPMALEDLIPNKRLETQIAMWIWQNCLPRPERQRRSEPRYLLIANR